MEHWRKDNEKGKREYSEKSLSKCQVVHHKSHKNRHGRESGVSLSEDFQFEIKLKGKAYFKRKFTVRVVIHKAKYHY
jgi:hypothetical protein